MSSAATDDDDDDVHSAYHSCICRKNATVAGYKERERESDVENRRTNKQKSRLKPFVCALGLQSTSEKERERMPKK